MTNPKLQSKNPGLGVPGGAYNPNPSCYCYEITGINPTILTPEKCFRPRKKYKKRPHREDKKER